MLFGSRVERGTVGEGESVDGYSLSVNLHSPSINFYSSSVIFGFVVHFEDHVAVRGGSAQV
jgi:hypothetical protein